MPKLNLSQRPILFTPGTLYLQVASQSMVCYPFAIHVLSHIYKGSSILQGMLYPLNKRVRWEQRTLSIKIASTIGKYCYAFEWTLILLKRSIVSSWKSTASLKGHVASRVGMYFFPLDTAYLKWNSVCLKRSCPFSRNAAFSEIKIAFFQEHCTCVQGCLVEYHIDFKWDTLSRGTLHLL